MSWFEHYKYFMLHVSCSVGKEPGTQSPIQASPHAYHEQVVHQSLLGFDIFQYGSRTLLVFLELYHFTTLRSRVWPFPTRGLFEDATAPAQSITGVTVPAQDS